MKARIFLMFAAAAALLAGCAKEAVAPEAAPQGKITIPVGISPMVKTHLGALEGTSHKVYWSNGDKIAVNGVVSDALAGLEDDVQSAEFTFPEDPDLASGPYKVIYPASIYTDATHVTLPAVQTYKADGFADGMNPMVGYGATMDDIEVAHLCAIVKVQILRGSAPGSDEENIVSVRFKGRSGEQVAGLFGIDYENGTIAGASNNVEDQVVRVNKNLPTSTDEAAVYYIVVPALTYENGFDVLVQDASGHVMTKSKTTSKTLEAGHIYAMTEFEFIPTTTELGIEISNAQELIDFATAYNNRQYESYGSALVATLTNDIAFDAETSAAFNATGGIGSPYGGTNYFDGTFDGGGFIISGLEATVPLFKAIGESGIVKDFLVNNDCSFTFTHPNTAEGMFGSIAGYHEGLIEGVDVLADVSLAPVVDVTKKTSLGGLVGCASVGVVDDCEYCGLISTPAGFTATTPADDENYRLLLGGLVGRFSDAGSVESSSFSGAISNEAQFATADTDNAYLKNNPSTVIGGVVGQVNGNASVVSCSTTANHEAIPSAYTNADTEVTMTGTIVHKSIIAYHSAVGGIVGELNNGTVSDCTNAAAIVCTIFKYNSADASARYIKSGGIVGRVNADGTVTGCTNDGTVQHRSNPRIQDLGGIVGYNAGTVKSCTNNAAVNHMTTGISGATKKGGRVVSLAGVIGENAAGATVSDVHNTAALQISAMENNFDSDNNKPICEARMGGVIAYNLADIDGGASKNITNTGQVHFNCNFDKQFIGYEIGGVVGYSTKSVKNAKNSGYVTLTWNTTANVASKMYLGGIVGQMAGNGSIIGCVNEGGSSNAGEVYPNLKSGSPGHNNIFAGGILGYSTKDVTISDCSNSGYVHGGNGTRVNGTSFYVGGIVAYLKGASQILNCSNTGAVVSTHNNNNDNIGSCALTGGIAGHVEGTEDDPIIVGGSTGCSVGANISGNRGWVGAIAAYAKYVNMSSCTASQDINCAARGVGGLVGKAENCSISSSSFTGEKVHANNVQATTGQGGIVGNLANSTVDGCSCYATTLTNNVSIATVGTIVGVSGTNNIIQNCHYKATVTTTAGSVTSSIVGTGTFSGSDNVADL